MYLHLDPSIRNWVFFPLTAITVLVNLLMKYFSILLNQGKKDENKQASKNADSGDFKSELQSRDIDIKIKHAINRSLKLRTNFMNISERGYKLRKAFFCKESEGFFCQRLENKAAEMMNPNMMVDMLKKNVVNALYYILIFVGCGYFFSGFIMLKLPFGLTQKFRTMLQQGLNLPGLDVSYVSSISWCFILVFGLNGILQHFDGEDKFSILKEQEKMMTAPMQMGGPQEKDYSKILGAEKENIEILPHFSHLEDSVDKLLEKYDYLVSDSG